MKKVNEVITKLDYIRNTAFCKNTIHRLKTKEHKKVDWGWGYLIWDFGILLNILTPEELTKLDRYLLDIDPDNPDNNINNITYEFFADYIKELQRKYS